MSPTPAMRFLLEFARVPMPSERVVPPDDLDWDEVLRLAAVHGMEPALFRQLSTTGHDRVPRDVWNRIVAAQMENAHRNLAATAELLAILRDLEAAGIPAITYKGPVLALQLYGDTGARRFGDLDVMVRPSQVRAAAHVLLRRGYLTELALPGWQFERFIEVQKEIALIHHETRQEVDLQWTVTERSFSLRWDLREMWGRSVFVNVAGKLVRTFAPDDLALILCVHGTAHLWERLGWVADVGALVTANTADWAEVINRSRALRAERMVLLSLELADLVTGCGIPADLMGASSAGVLTGKVFDRVTSPDRAELADHPRPFDLLLARSRGGARERLRYLLALAVTPTLGDWQAIRLPRHLSLLYRVIRPFRLAGRYGRAFLLGRRGPPPRD